MANKLYADKVQVHSGMVGGPGARVLLKMLVRSYQHLVQVDVHEGKHAGHEGRRCFFGLRRSRPGLLLHHWLLGLLLLWLVLLLLVLRAVTEGKKSNKTANEPNLICNLCPDGTSLTLLSRVRSLGLPLVLRQLSGSSRDML